MKKIIYPAIPLYTLYSILSTAPLAHAVCPVCTIAVAGGLGLSRYFGIDDLISGLWVGGLIISSAFWAADWLHKRKAGLKLRFLNIAFSVVFFLLTIVPLYFAQIIGHPFNTIWGLDKLVAGTLFGIVIFLFALFLDAKVRQINGKQLFIYQKVVFPVVSLAIMSLIFYFALPK